jgi:uncharacterized membrane protein YgcG
MVLAISLLGLGLAGVALAGVSTGSVKGAGAIEVNVVVMDGRLTVKPTKLTAGKVTFVAVNKGKVKHALAIMGNGLAPKRTPALAAGKSARLVVTLKPGQYHVWDPVTSSMSRATYLTVRKAASTGGSGGAAAKPSGGSAGSGGYDYGGGGGASGGATPGGMDGMDGCDH